MTRRLVKGSMVLALVGGLLAGCGGDGGPAVVDDTPRPTTANSVAGDAQTGTVGAALPQQLTVQVNDQNGQPMSGVAVTFTVDQGGGTVSPSQATTDGGGNASTTWTLGTTAGAPQQVTAAAGNLKATFMATATPDAPAVISKVSGDQQFAFRGTKLAEPLVVHVRDQFANGVPNVIVEFTAQPGNGVLDSAAAFTDGQGNARSGWTMPDALGGFAAQASSGGVTGSPLSFAATAHNIQVTSVTSPLVPGQTAVILGTGFSTTASENEVLIGDLTATVDVATDTRLDITVPNVCEPARALDVRVSVNQLPAAPFASTFEPSAFLGIAVGEQVVIQDPAAFCLQFDQQISDETYLIGVQSTIEDVTSLTGVRLTSVAAGPAPGAPALVQSPPSQAGNPQVPPSLRRRLTSPAWQSHRRTHPSDLEFIRSEYDAVRAARSTQPLRAASSIPNTLMVGDPVTLRVPSPTVTGCSSFVEINATVRAIGARGIFIEDNANPTSYTDADYQTFSADFDAYVYDTNVAQFGTPSDNDANALIAIVITQQVNIRGSLGRVSPCDFAVRSPTNEQSNDGEIVYVASADPNGDAGFMYPLEFAKDDLPAIVGHELVHVIQISGRLAQLAALPRLWILESQAQLGEEILGHQDENHAVDQNLGLAVALNLDDPSSTDWYSSSIADLAFYFGWDVIRAGPDAHLSDAPHECSWLELPQDEGGNNTGPCDGGRDVYGTPWTLLRWLSDQYRSTYPGGEAGFHQDIITSSLDGFELIETLIGEPIEDLLASWGAVLYVDDRPGFTTGRLSLPSWDLFDIFYGSAFDPSQGFDVSLRVALRLQPRDEPFGNFARNVSVRGASTYYQLLSGARAATAVRIRTGSDGQLPQHMQVWIVRVE